jgi:hypothetical protein
MHLNPSGGRSPRRTVLLRLAWTAGCFALSAPVVVGGDDDARPRSRPAGDGRGLATFGDRGLTTFSDRGLASFGDRGLTSFSDIPLAPMGGLVPGEPAPAGARADSGSSRRRSRRSIRVQGFSSGERGSRSFATLAPEGAATRAARALVLLPAVAVPPLVLDHGAAAADIAARLELEVGRALAAGDQDVARTLSARPR